jgi:glycerol-3-phosphate dehydrogenase
VRLLFVDAAAARRVAPLVAALLARELGKDEAWQQQQVNAFDTLARGYLLPDHRPDKTKENRA